jgi:hypothetical protein
MEVFRRTEVRIYVDRKSEQWIVLDPEGNFWSLPSSEKPWDDRQPFTPAEETELDPVPGHYKFILGIPGQHHPSRL